MNLRSDKWETEIWTLIKYKRSLTTFVFPIPAVTLSLHAKAELATHKVD